MQCASIHLYSFHSSFVCVFCWWKHRMHSMPFVCTEFKEISQIYKIIDSCLRNSLVISIHLDSVINMPSTGENKEIQSFSNKNWTECDQPIKNTTKYTPIYMNSCWDFLDASNHITYISSAIEYLTFEQNHMKRNEERHALTAVSVPVYAPTFSIQTSKLLSSP